MIFPFIWCVFSLSSAFFSPLLSTPPLPPHFSLLPSISERSVILSYSLSVVMNRFLLAVSRAALEDSGATEDRSEVCGVFST